METTITHDWRGTRAATLPSDVIGPEAHKTFTYALGCFSYLLDRGETITLEAWRWRIAKHCAPSDRIAAVLRAIDAARGAVNADGKRYLYLKKDRQERFNTRRAWFVNAWRIVDADGYDVVQPWMRTKTEARAVAATLNCQLIEG